MSMWAGRSAGRCGGGWCDLRNALRQDRCTMEVATAPAPKERSYELCFFLVVWPLYFCFAYAAVYVMHTPTRIIPLRVCVCVPMQGHRPCKTMPQRTCLPTPSRSRLTFAYATIVPSAFCSVACHAAPCRGTSQQALNRTLLPAAAHAPRSQSAPQVPGTQVPDH